MTSEEKKASLLLHSVIFHYHGLDESEQQVLNETATELDAFEELDWANNFIQKDCSDAFDRARDFLRDIMLKFEKEIRLKHLSKVWAANNKKGYISEIEATAMLKLAGDWEVEIELINEIKNMSKR